mmetsp:Transcript_26296/g.63124  ORF Transcript_26296/g.63124 Transcript_26296/m.63124 type:complete len:204 (+) Transcript_26296:107-718(+)
MEFALSEPDLDQMMGSFDSGSATTITLDELKFLLYELRCDLYTQQNGYSFWKHLDEFLKRSLSETGVIRTLDKAFIISDIETVEHMVESCSDIEMKMLDRSSECALVTFAVHLKGIPAPLVISSSKPGNTAAWLDAFRVCMAWQCKNIDWGDDEDVNRDRNPHLPEVDQSGSNEWRSSRIDWGLGDDYGTENQKGENSHVDWG